jgi:hypothetical protein
VHAQRGIQTKNEATKLYEKKAVETCSRQFFQQYQAFHEFLGTKKGA